jgi:hypothetical protein
LLLEVTGAKHDETQIARRPLTSLRRGAERRDRRYILSAAEERRSEREDT